MNGVPPALCSSRENNCFLYSFDCNGKAGKEKMKSKERYDR